jgi:oligopeptide transport system ATP-binding protein
MTNVKSTESLLELRGLNMNIGAAKPIRDVSLTLYQGETHAIVGESGCGKSMTALSLMGLQPTQATISAEHWKFGGKPVAYQSEKDWRQLRRNDIAMIFQNPMSSLNPTTRIGTQIAEVLLAKGGVSRATAKHKTIELLEATQIRQPEVRARQYPFELSGGMLQRAMIAMAMACKPRLLIADEPTTALDATVQAEVLSLLKQLQQETSMAMLLITHDLGVVAQVADKVSVMYAGEIIEQASVKQLFQATAHPYTAALKPAVPS